MRVVQMLIKIQTNVVTCLLVGYQTHFAFKSLPAKSLGFRWEALILHTV